VKDQPVAVVGTPGPLHGVRVIELAGMGPAPFACMLLADLGAEVIRIDRPVGGELDVPDQFELLNRGKKSIILDLKTSKGVDVVLRLAETADAIVEGFRPGVVERLGLGPDAVMARNPAIVFGRMSGWGQRGPAAQTAGHDISYIALTGALHGIGPADGAPQIPLNLVGDFGGGSLYLAVGLLAGIQQARNGGRGSVVDAAILDGTLHLMTMFHGMMAAGQWADVRGANTLDGGAPFYAVYETADKRHMAVGALEAKFYHQLIEGLGLNEDPADQYNREDWPGLRARIAQRFKEKTRDDWVRTFECTDACVAPVLSMTESASDPHVAARHAMVDVGDIVQPGISPRFSTHPDTTPGRPALAGAATREVLAAIGLDPDQLIADGIALDRRKQ